MSDNSSLEKARATSLRLIGYLNLLMIPVPATGAWLAGVSPLPFLALSIAIAVVTVGVQRTGGAFARIAVSVGVIGQLPLLTAALAGHPWQVDTHLIYFAVLATLVILQDERALLAGSAVVILHHAVLTLVMPNLVYPSGGLVADILRLALHGTVWVAETAALIYLVRVQLGQRAQIEEESTVLSEALENSKLTQDQLHQAEAEQTRVMDSLSDALSRMSGGDLSASLTEPFPDRYERLRDDYNAALSALGKAMHDVQLNAESIRSDTGNIASASQELARRTEHQSHALGDVTQKIDEISGSMTESASEARSAMSETEATRTETESGMEVVSGAIEAMKRIEESSTRIRTITDVIDDLAVQTNLLALNAGVEAARAGAAGQGFAVVASEVRALAQRSSEAAGQITGLISESASDVQNGVTLVDSAGEVLRGVLASVRRISETMEKIAGSVTRHSDGLSGLRGTMTDLDSMTQQNAAMFEETSAATTALTSATDQLSEIIRQFQNAEGAAPASLGRAA